MNVCHQNLDRPAAMIPRDVRVDVKPKAFDPIRVWAVRRQKVEGNALAELLEEALGLLAAVDDVVVEDEVNPPGLGIREQDSPDESAEEIARLRLALGTHDSPGARAHRARQVVL